MRFIAIRLLLSAALAAPIAAWSQEDDVERLARLAFLLLDEGERGYVEPQEFSEFGARVFSSMDVDGDEFVSLPEFMSRDYGMRAIATQVGREDAYDTAMRVVFALWDRNGDRSLSRAEHSLAVASDFEHADIIDDDQLNQDEFTAGFSVIVALRAVIHPIPSD